MKLSEGEKIAQVEMCQSDRGGRRYESVDCDDG